MHLSLPRRRAGWIICFFKNLDRKRLSRSLGPKRTWRVMDESTSDHTHPPSRQQAAVGGSRASSKAIHARSAKLWKQVNVHRTLRPLLGPPRARSLHSTLLPYRGYVDGPDSPACAGSCPAVSLAPKDHLTRLCDSVRPASSQVQGHPPHSSEGSRCPCLVRGITVLLAKDVMEPVPPADMKAGFFSPSNQIKSLLSSHHHSTSALVSEILKSVLHTVQKKQQFTYGQYIFTDCTEDNVQNTHTYTQYT